MEEENIRFNYVLKDGTMHEIEHPSTTIFEAAHELLESIALGDAKIDPRDVVQITDIPG